MRLHVSFATPHMLLPIEIETLRNEGLHPLQVVWNIQLTRWMNAAAISLLIYDTFLVLGDEVELYWPKRWSVIKTFYFSNRALCAIVTLLNAQQFIGARPVSDGFCTYSLVGVGFATYVSFAMCNWMLLARTRALVGLERPHIDTALVIYFAVSYLITGALALATVVKLHDKFFYSPATRMCAVSIHPKTMGLIWICPLLFETTIFIITAVKIHQRTRLHNGRFASHLYSVLFRDGVCYYATICLFRIWNLVIWNLRPVSPLYMGIFMLWSIMSIACSRLQLNLLKATSPLNDTTEASADAAASGIPRHGIVTFGQRADGNRWAHRKPHRKPPSTLDATGGLPSTYNTHLQVFFSTFIPSIGTLSNSTATTSDNQPLELEVHVSRDV